MVTINTYLNFDGKAEEAFNFYKSVLGGEFASFQRMNATPEGGQLAADEQNRLMHVALPVGNGMLMASDIAPSMGHKLTVGNNYYVSIHAASEDEGRKIFNGLSAGGKIEAPFEKMFWGAFWGAFTDKFGVQWMVNFDPNLN